ncbi:hypothetical protein BX600DRAFT_471697 [Xylariales sp. PMI_506]|nr:hypothetical protein BX600DRAFT_471697 [Xylariales sp. PMI_506]
MPSLRAAVHLVAGASLIATSEAYGFGGYGGEFGQEGPYGANTLGWLDAVDASNSTGLFSISGYNVSEPYPGSPVDGWSLSVAAVDVSNFGERMVGYSMTLKAPDALIGSSAAEGPIVDVDPSWGLCVWNYESPPEYSNRSTYNNPDNKPLATDGSCSGLLSDACIAALEKAAETSYWISSETYGHYNSNVICDTLDTPAECGASVGNTISPIISTSGLPIQYLNGSVTYQDGWVWLPGDSTDINATVQDLEDMWDSMVLNFWPLMTLFIPMTNNTSIEDPKPGLAKLQCISPDGVGTGKVFSYSQPESNGTSVNSTDGTNSTANGGGDENAAGAVYSWWGPVVGGLVISILAQV